MSKSADSLLNPPIETFSPYTANFLQNGENVLFLEEEMKMRLSWLRTYLKTFLV